MVNYVMAWEGVDFEVWNSINGYGQLWNKFMATVVIPSQLIT